jgi:hypothetical protein
MGKLGGAPHKLDNIIQFHVGDTITALSRAVMQQGGSEVLLYATIMGGVGAFFPFQAKEVRVCVWRGGGASEGGAVASGCGVVLWGYGFDVFWVLLRRPLCFAQAASLM